MKKELMSLKVLIKIRFNEVCNCRSDTFFIIQVSYIKNSSINEYNGSAINILKINVIDYHRTFLTQYLL